MPSVGLRMPLVICACLRVSMGLSIRVAARAALAEAARDASRPAVERISLTAIVHALRFGPLLPLLVLVDQPQYLIFFNLLWLLRLLTDNLLRMTLSICARRPGNLLSLLWLGPWLWPEADLPVGGSLP